MVAVFLFRAGSFYRILWFLANLGQFKEQLFWPTPTILSILLLHNFNRLLYHLPEYFFINITQFFHV